MLRTTWSPRASGRCFSILTAGTRTSRRNLIPIPGGAMETARASDATLDGVAIAARAERAVKVYGTGDATVRALDGVTVEFPSGRYTAVMGPSGSGKSTLLHCLAGLDTLTSGRVFIGTTDLTTLSEKKLTLLRREKVGFVFQAFNLVPTLNASENIT